MTLQLAPAQFETLRMGALIVANQPTVSSLPLEHTDVVAQVCGPLASVAVTQRFGNPFADPVELAYLFPLPHEAAVVDFELRIGQRVIRSELQELEAARQTYATARAEGKRAGLLEQRRPNLFSVELANVQPGETIIATLRYHERLRFDDGSYEFVFPMGITPKFHADPAEAAAVDAPIATAGAPVGRIELSLAVDAGTIAGDPQSPSHQIELTRLDSRRFSLRLPGDVLPNKDFVLRYPVSGDSVSAAAWTSAGEAGTPWVAGAPSTALISALPPRLDDEVEPAPREFVFVIDRSGSMSGGPLDQARNALRACLRALGPQDTFSIQAFDDRIEWLTGGPLPVTQAAVEQADRWLGGIDARGGTDILEALEAALRLPADRERQRYVVFLTDGAVSAEDAALARVERYLGTMRLFTFGIGPSVNRALLARMAERGRGTAEFLQLDEDIETAIMRFQDRVAYPVLQDIELAWEGATAWDVYPARLPDLYNGQPLELVARYMPTGPGRLVISGRRDRDPVRLEVALPAPAAVEPIVASAWAKARVTALLDTIREDIGKTGALRGEIIGLAIQHRLLTPYTAFVAVDSQAPEQKSADARRVEIAQPLPEGLDMAGFGAAPRGMGTGALGIALPAAAGAPPPPPSMQPAPASPPKPVSPLARLRSAASDLTRRTIRPLSEEKKVAPPSPEPDLTPFSLDDLGLDDDEVASLSADDRILEAGDIAMTPFSFDSLSQSPAEEPAPAEEEAAGADDVLRWLARRQNVSGSWGAEDVEMTAAALLAFVRAGHTTRAGHYRRQLARALKWLRASSATGGAGQARAQALAEMAAASGDGALQQEAEAARAALPAMTPPASSPLATMDDLRAAALTRTVLPVAPNLLRGDRSGLARTWQAALVKG